MPNSSRSTLQISPTVQRARSASRNGRLFDLRLDEPLLASGDRASELVHALDQLAGALLKLVRELLDEIRAPERVGGIGAAALVREDLLRPQRDPDRVLGRQRERL